MKILKLREKSFYSKIKTILLFSFIYAAPASTPPDFVVESNAPTSLTLEWKDIPTADWGGELLGYKIYYKKYLDKEFQMKVVNHGFLTATLADLTPYTMYRVDIHGFNSAGEGPPEYGVLKTQQGGKLWLFLINGTFSTATVIGVCLSIL